jgi:hypothetical protein
MQGTVGLFISLVIVALGLAGLGFALTNLMITGHPESALVPIGGLAVFVLACLSMMVVAYRS